VQVLPELANISGEDVQLGNGDFVGLVSLRLLDARVLAVDLEVDSRGFALGYLRLVLLKSGAEGRGKDGAVEGSLLMGVGWHTGERHLLALAVLAHKYIRITTNNSLQPFSSPYQL
jgi:hypothetical protein